MPICFAQAVWTLKMNSDKGEFLRNSKCFRTLFFRAPVHEHYFEVRMCFGCSLNKNNGFNFVFFPAEVEQILI